LPPIALNKNRRSRLAESIASNGNLKVTVEFHPQERVTRVPSGTSVFNAANWIGLPIDSTCGGLGTCGKCRVRLLAGSNLVTAADRQVFTEEELAAGWRLSCRATAYEDVICEVPRLMGSPKAALMGFGRHVILDPNIHKVVLQLEPPSLEDQRSDFNRIRDALDEAGFEVSAELAVLRQIPHVLRQSRWHVTAVVAGQELLAVEAGDTSDRMYGLAFDIGTTSVVGMLMNLNNGAPAAVRSTLNGQAIYGADVISRISHAMMNEGGLDQLREKILLTINGLIEQLLNDANITPREVYEAVAVGNATMLHLLLGLDPEAIGVTPFIPVVDRLVYINACEVGLRIHPQAKLCLLPHLGAYVGADLVGGLLATGLAQNDGVRLLVDVGTNGEIILGSQARTVATAAPAGPAFEGAQIKDGMRASEGAIEAVQITQEDVRLQVIGDVPPVGLCGSGLLDAVAQLRLVELLDFSGKLVELDEAAQHVAPAIASRLITLEGGLRAFVLAWGQESGHGRPIVLTQRDIRELQFAKAAIASGIDVVMRELGVTPLPVERIKAVGNAAGEGAKIALLSFREREVVRALPGIVEYHELSGRADFNDSFISVLQFPDLAELSL
jgi:uncharacterized 2Fe-2S/4Fe-4S cluster protein (DUF4445 family)